MKWSHKVEKYVPSGIEWDLNSGLYDSGAWPNNHCFPAPAFVFQGATDPPVSSTAHTQVDCSPVVLSPFFSHTSVHWAKEWYLGWEGMICWNVC